MVTTLSHHETMVAPAKPPRQRNVRWSDLARQWKDGDHAAFSEIERDARPVLTARFRRLVPCSEDCEDLTQEVFLRLHRFRGRVMPEQIAPWLFLVGDRLAIDWLRKRNRRKSTSLSANPGLEPFARDSNPSCLFETAERDERLEQALAMLSPKQRDALLNHLEGSTYAKMNERTGVSPKTLGSRAFRGKHKLRQLLADLT